MVSGVSESVGVVGIGLSISRPLAVDESMAVSESMSVSVERISLGLRLSFSLPLAIDETMAISISYVTISESISQSVVSKSISGVSQVRIGLSLGEGHSGQAGNNNGFNHLGLFPHLVLGGESPC